MPRSDGRRFFLGIGVSARAEIGDVIALAEAVVASAGIAAGRIACIATIESRRDHAAVLELSRRFDAPVVCFPASALEAETPRLKNPSEALFARIGCHGVAEAAALAAAGETGSLVVEKTGGVRTTAAIAVCQNDF